MNSHSDPPVDERREVRGGINLTRLESPARKLQIDGWAAQMAERIVHILPEQVANQIAAGEVVERPASALKELVENSLDAGAHAVNVEMQRGGSGLITVADDGCGMGREDAILSVHRHATSKVRDGSDLLAIRTLGFRGEALASISSVAHLRMQTRRPGDDHGIEVVVNGGEVAQTRVCAIAPGTRIEVRDLFFNTPARLKFLKTVATEQASSRQERCNVAAFANFKVAFRLVADDRVLFEVPRAASALERLRQLFGARLAERMLGFELEQSGKRARGLAAMSHESFPTPRLVLTFVNQRAVRDRMLMRAIAQAYQTLLPRGRHPAVALFVELRPEEVDVNVHPMKTEVRLRRSGAVFELVYHALRARLADPRSQRRPHKTGKIKPGVQARLFRRARVLVGRRRIGRRCAAKPCAPSRHEEQGNPPSRVIGGQPERVLRLVAEPTLSARAAAAPQHGVRPYNRRCRYGRGGE